MIDFLFVIVFLALLIGSITDFQTREVPDLLSYGLILTGFSLNIILSLWHENSTFIIESIAGFALCFVLGAILFYTGQWGGGDAKLIWGIGATIGLPLSLETMPFLILFIINSFLVGAAFGVVWMLALAIKNYHEFIKDAKQKIKQHKKIIYIFIASFVVITITPIFFSPGVTDILAIYIAFMFLLLLLPVLMFSIRLVEAKYMYREINPTELVPGDWIVENEATKKIGYDIPKTGIPPEDIEILKNNKKIKNVLVKEGIPFVPSFFLSFIVTEFYGNWFMSLFLLL